MTYETTCPGCKTRVSVIERPMGVPGGQDMEQGDCPLCLTTVAEFMTDGFISVKVIESEHQLLQTIFNASRGNIPLPPHIVEAAGNFIAAGLVTLTGTAHLSIPIEVQQALLRNHQPLKVL